MKKKNSIPPKFFQEYLEALAVEPSEEQERARKLLTGYAELQYKLRGGSKCAVCHAHVRHVVPVHAEREDGTAMEFDCLCTRCLEAEKALSRVVTMRLGDAKLQYVRSSPMAMAATPSARAGRPGT